MTSPWFVTDTELAGILGVPEKAMKRRPKWVEHDRKRMLTPYAAAKMCGLSQGDFLAMARDGILPPRQEYTGRWCPKEVAAGLDRLPIKSGRLTHGFVYFMETGRFIKCGHSVWPESRRRDLQYCMPYDLTLLAQFPGSPTEENRLHTTVLARLRLRNEWFHRTKGLLAYIEWLKRRAT